MPQAPEGTGEQQAVGNARLIVGTDVAPAGQNMGPTWQGEAVGSWNP